MMQYKKTESNTHTKTQKQTNYGFCDTKKHLI